MCGIAGICDFAGHDINVATIEKMIKVLEHRGPDGKGVYTSKLQNPNSKARAVLGHRRLSIIDLETGDQPMANEDKTAWVVYNGETYNFKELRDELKEKGHSFRTRSDTEVIIHLYEEEGVDCVRRLRGMFAFAIWDSRAERLFLARDRIGMKPLVYYHANNRLVFASEIKALLETDISREVDAKSVDAYLSYGYTPSPRTILKGIHKLPPAHILTCDRNGIKTRRYWQLNFSKKERWDEMESQERIMSILRESIRIRLMSDVPLGAFLSGGLDSSAVVALMGELSSKPVQTFSVGFREEDFDELKYARVVADRVGTDHHELIIKPDSLDILPKLVWHYNEPFGDSSCIPTYYLARATSKFVKVALNGDGGDETFAGYERYQGALASEYLNAVPRPLFHLALAAWRMGEGPLRRVAGRKVYRKVRRVEDFLKGMLTFPDALSRYFSWMTCFHCKEKERLYADSLKKELGDINSFGYLNSLAMDSDAKNLVDKLLHIDSMSYLPEDLLVKTDIAGMANSLECRSPFLDHELMECAARLPAHMKLKKMKSKYILKRALGDTLPPPIVRRKKMGFGVPLERWFGSELKTYIYDVLLDRKSIKRGYFRRDYVKRLLDEHTQGKKNHMPRIWALLNLEVWHRVFIDREGI